MSSLRPQVAYTKALVPSIPGPCPRRRDTRGRAHWAPSQPWSALGARLHKRTGTHTKAACLIQPLCRAIAFSIMMRTPIWCEPLGHSRHFSSAPSPPISPMHLSAFHIPRGSGKTTWEPTATSTSTATPCFRAEILGSEPPGTPQIQQVYGAMNPLLAYTLAPMHRSAFYIPRGSGKSTWEPTSSSTPTATPCFRAEILGSEPPGTPQIQQVYGAMKPLLAYTLAPMHWSAFYIPRALHGHSYFSPDKSRVVSQPVLQSVHDFFPTKTIPKSLSS
ncbi:hypothetical protein THAOC_26769 [Thalassiosira oceanica]|uniref:Uncharacterized protein n=1 Tax=Thalassiosira oceanica TaxID=159749 RepID=K0RKM5_THAOC|nr:hypothetical protein THAOC_26769 [Thalassiosira oceanica]|eukprot:EJK53730.1 hypothetical protein THAOC_26769 [Thalassiosira oceanica]